MSRVRANSAAHRSETGYAVRPDSEANTLSRIHEIAKLNGNHVIIVEDICLKEDSGYTPIRHAN